MLKGFVNRLALFCEKLWTIRRDVQTVFESNTKLTVDHDRGFITETHTRLDRRLVAAHEVSPFVTIETDSMPGAMRQTRHFVIRTKTSINDHFARGRIHCFT